MNLKKIKTEIDELQLGDDFYKKHRNNLQKLKEFPHSLGRVFCDDKVWFHIPKCVTEPYGLFYRMPIAYTCEGLKDLLNGGRLRNFLKEKYPIQFFFRETVSLFFFRLAVRFNDFFYKLQCNLQPRNEEVRKVIPKIYTDSYYLIPEVLFACLKMSVERDSSLLSICSDGLAPNEKRKLTRAKKELEEAYDYFYSVYSKKKEWDEVDEEKETRMLVNIVKNRRHLW